MPAHPGVLIALDPRAASGSSPRVVWLRRFIALGTVSLLTALFARACMRS